MQSSTKNGGNLSGPDEALFFNLVVARIISWEVISVTTLRWQIYYLRRCMDSAISFSISDEENTLLKNTAKVFIICLVLIISLLNICISHGLEF